MVGKLSSLKGASIKIVMILVLTALSLTGCFEQKVGETQKATTIIIQSDKTEIKADNLEYITLSAFVKDQNGNIMNGQTIRYYYQLNGGNEIEMQGNTFKSDVSGTYTFKAKTADIKSANLSVKVNELPKPYSISITASKNTILADGTDAVTFQAIVIDQYGSTMDVSKLDIVYYSTYNSQKVKINSNSFSTITIGNYYITAKVSNIESESIKIISGGSDSADVAEAFSNLTFDTIANGNSAENNILSILKLDKTGLKGTVINWIIEGAANGANIDTDTGAISRGTIDTVIKLTAQISKGTALQSKSFNLTIKMSDSAKDNKDIADAKQLLTFEIIKGLNANQDYITTILNLPITGENGTTIKWSVAGELNGASVNISTGDVTRGNANTAVVLTATITKNRSKDTKDFILIIISATSVLDTADVINAKNILTFGAIKADNISEDAILDNLNLIKTIGNNVTLEWSVTGASNGCNINPENGVVVRGTTDSVLTLTATLKKGTSVDKKDFKLNILISDASTVVMAKNALTFETISLKNINENNIVGSLVFPKSGINGTTIKWSKSGNISDADIDLETGSVTRGKNDTIITATAIISKGKAEESKIFYLTIKAANDSVDVSLAKTMLSFENIKKDNSVESYIKGDLNLNVTSSIDNVLIKWKVAGVANGASINTTSGAVTRGTSDTTITLTAILTKGIFTETKDFFLTIIRDANIDINDAKSILTFDYIKGQNANIDNITLDLNLTKQIGNTSIVWSVLGANNGANINTETGTVTRGTTDCALVLRAEISKDGISLQKDFPMIIKISEVVKNTKIVENAKASLVFDLFKGTNTELTNITNNLSSLPKTFGTVDIAWIKSGESNGADINLETGEVIRGTTNVDITLTATLTKGTVSRDKTFILTVIESQASQDSRAVNAADLWLTPDRVLNGNISTNITSGLLLPTTDANSVTFKWSKEITVNGGGDINLSDGTFKLGYTGDTTVVLTAEISKGASKLTKQFTVIIKKSTAEVDMANAKNGLNFDTIKKNNTDKNNITNDLTLLTSFSGVTITWSAVTVSGDAVIKPSGVVVRGTSDSSITIKAILTKEIFTNEITFDVVVKMTQISKDGLVGFYSFDDKNANDSVSNLQNGTAYNLTYGDGKRSNAGYFNGTTSYVTIANPINMTSSAFTISVWCKNETTDLSGKDFSVVSLGKESVEEIILRDGKWNFNMCFGGVMSNYWISAVDQSIDNINQWKLITAVFKKGEYLKLYLNGVLSTNVAHNDALAQIISIYNNPQVGITLGCTQDVFLNTKKAFFKGYIDDVRIYNRVLTDSEILTLYQE